MKESDRTPSPQKNTYTYVHTYIRTYIHTHTHRFDDMAPTPRWLILCDNDMDPSQYTHARASHCSLQLGIRRGGLRGKMVKSQHAVADYYLFCLLSRLSCLFLPDCLKFHSTYLPRLCFSRSLCLPSLSAFRAMVCVVVRYADQRLYLRRPIRSCFLWLGSPRLLTG